MELAYIFQHLNRAWNRRGQTDKEALEKFTENSKFPTDMSTVE